MKRSACSTCCYSCARCCSLLLLSFMSSIVVVEYPKKFKTELTVNPNIEPPAITNPICLLPLILLVVSQYKILGLTGVFHSLFLFIVYKQRFVIFRYWHFLRNDYQVAAHLRYYRCLLINKKVFWATYSVMSHGLKSKEIIILGCEELG